MVEALLSAQYSSSLPYIQKKKKAWKVGTGTFVGTFVPVLKHLTADVNPLPDAAQYVFPAFMQNTCEVPYSFFSAPFPPFSHLCIFLHPRYQNISHLNSGFYNQRIIRKVEAFLSLSISHFQLLNETTSVSSLNALNCGRVMWSQREGRFVHAVANGFVDSLPLHLFRKKEYMP